MEMRKVGCTVKLSSGYDMPVVGLGTYGLDEAS